MTNVHSNHNKNSLLSLEGCAEGEIMNVILWHINLSTTTFLALNLVFIFSNIWAYEWVNSWDSQKKNAIA